MTKAKINKKNNPLIVLSLLATDSVMHYSPFTFSKWSVLTPTLWSKEKGYSFWRKEQPSKVSSFLHCIITIVIMGGIFIRVSFVVFADAGISMVFMLLHRLTTRS